MQRNIGTRAEVVNDEVKSGTQLHFFTVPSRKNMSNPGDRSGNCRNPPARSPRRRRSDRNQVFLQQPFKGPILAGSKVQNVAAFLNLGMKIAADSFQNLRQDQITEGMLLLQHPFCHAILLNIFICYRTEAFVSFGAFKSSRWVVNCPKQSSKVPENQAFPGFDSVLPRHTSTIFFMGCRSFLPVAL